jgi:hypothetical protein
VATRHKCGAGAVFPCIQIRENVMAAREMAVGVALGVIVLALAGAAFAEPQQETAASAFDGVWAPERRGPPG